MTLRVSAIGLTDRILPKKIASGSQSPKAAFKGARGVHFQEAGNFIDCPIYERELLKGGNRVQGPAVHRATRFPRCSSPPRFAWRWILWADSL